MKYMTGEEWTILEENFQGKPRNLNNPSLSIGDSFKGLLEYFDDIHTFITRLCLAEKLPQSCISTAMVFFHKYFIQKKVFSNDLEKYMACAACILVSVKVCNQLTPLEELVKFFLKQYTRQMQLNLAIDNQLVFETSERLCMLEFEILSAVGFDLNLDLPYRYVHQMKSYYFDYLGNPKLIIITTNFINDSFKVPLCLYFDPLLIALAGLHLASVYFNVPLPATKEGVKWFNLLDETVELKQVVALSEKINKIYKFCSEPKVGSKEAAKRGKANPVLQFAPTDHDILHILNPGVSQNEAKLNLIKGSNLDARENSNLEAKTSDPGFP